MNILYCKNRKAFHDYEIIETYEAGIVLFGSEVKEIKNNKSSLDGSFAIINDNVVKLLNFKMGNLENREIILLLNKKEIYNIQKELVKGYSLIPLVVYYTNNYIKLEIALCKGLKKFDKRQVLKDKDLIKSESSKIKL
jgi:SsrA-binding protein